MRSGGYILAAAVSGLWFAASGAGARAATVTARLDGAADLESWKVSGGATLDTAVRRGEEGSALRVPPGARAVLPLREADGSGRVTFWIHDDGTVIANPKERHMGPRWGLMRADGHILAAGVLYAPYLAGDTTYTISDSDGKVWVSNVQYVGLKRGRGWHCWVFDYDAEKGVTLSFDDQPIKRFDWNRTAATGFASFAVWGDDPGGGKPQTVWVDDVEAELGGPMKAQPAPPPPPPPVVPDRDPAPEGPAVRMPDAVLRQHPRLLVTAAKLPALRAFYASEEAKPFRDKLLAYLPACANVPADNKCLSDATDAQRQGLWRLPTVALHYLLTSDASSLARAKAFLQWLNGLPDWETGTERNSGMGAANLMVGAALAFDWLWNDLDPVFRETFRKKLILQARAMYYGGHLMKSPGIHYWQCDPQNNHRWHRNAGLALSVLAAYSGAPEEQWILEKTAAELQFVADTLPPDGTSHESASYLVFGGQHLTLAMQACDECLGTRHLEAPFFRNLGFFRMGTLLPGLRASFLYGDTDGSGIGGYNPFFWKSAAVHRQADVMDGLRRLNQTDPKAFEFGWFSLLWYDPTLTGGRMERLPLHTFWPDIGLALMRAGWQDGAIAAMFKCGPLGGYTLNAYRNRRNRAYVNVAHDDPDANSFTIHAGDKMLAETDRYSSDKRSSHYNTILVNGMGQMVPGRAEGLGFSQPGNQDMSRMAVITAWTNAGNLVVVEGEAAGSYLAYADRRTGRSRPALERFRRTFLWSEGRYILVLDDVRSTQSADLTWLMQGQKLEATDAAAGRYVLRTGEASCGFHLLADQLLTCEVVPSPADTRGKVLGWQQLRATARGTAARFASVFDPWNRQPLRLALAPDGADRATVTVTGPGIEDVWTWQAAAGRFEPSTLTGKRPDGAAFRFDAAAAVPPPAAP